MVAVQKIALTSGKKTLHLGKCGASKKAELPNMWSISSIADVQGRALCPGSIPGAPLDR